MSDTKPTGVQAGSEAASGPKYSAVTALVVSSIVTVVVLASAVLLLLRLEQSEKDSPEASLSLVFVAAAVVLILVVSALSIVLRRLGLVDGEEPMGLPRGSIRAVIALLLIMLFFIAAIFLFNSTRATPSSESANRQLTGITAERLATIPTDSIRSSIQRVSGDSTLYDVVLYPVGLSTPTSDDLAKQLITTLSVLVTAVASFYFGANSVSGAHKDMASRADGGAVRRRTVR